MRIDGFENGNNKSNNNSKKNHRLLNYYSPKLERSSEFFRKAANVKINDYNVNGSHGGKNV